MKEKFNRKEFLRDYNNIVTTVVLRTLTDVDDDKFAAIRDSGEVLEIELIINGHSVSASRVLPDIYKEMSARINERARKLVEEEIEKVQEEVRTFTDILLETSKFYEEKLRNTGKVTDEEFREANDYARGC